jgi:hypothetical protein
MFPGLFNDILKADEHYIALDRNFGNIDEVLERFSDDRYRISMTNLTYEYIIDVHSHHNRIDEFLKLSGLD